MGALTAPGTEEDATFRIGRRALPSGDAAVVVAARALLALAPVDGIVRQSLAYGR